MRAVEQKPDNQLEWTKQMDHYPRDLYNAARVWPHWVWLFVRACDRVKRLFICGVRIALRLFNVRSYVNLYV